MNKTLEEKLFAAFPQLFRPRGKARVRLTGYGIEAGDGWYQLIYELCENIQKHADERGLDLHALQVKEKFGGLRFYIRGADEYIDKLIDEAERRSFTICEVCGEPGTLRRHLWMRTMCDKHDEEYVRDQGADDEEDAEC